MPSTTPWIGWSFEIGLNERIPSMPTMLTGSELRDAVQHETFIEGGDVSCAEGVKYDFRLSTRILKARFNLPVDASRLSDSEKRELRIDPGEVVFVLTQERLKLPNNITAQLSPKRKLSHAGILTLGGFCIDPGYQGRLLIGLFNFSSTPFQLIPGKKLIAATFSVWKDLRPAHFLPAWTRWTSSRTN